MCAALLRAKPGGLAAGASVGVSSMLNTALNKGGGYLEEEGLHVVLDELGQVLEELGGVCAVDVAVVAGEGDRHLLDHAHHAW